MKGFSLLKKMLFVTATFTCSLASVQAGTLLIDTAPVIEPNVQSERCDGAVSLKVVPEQDTVIDQLDAYINPLAPTNIRFMIAANPQNTVLYYGPPVAVAAGIQWVQSPAFSFTLLQGQTYEIAAMVEGCAIYPWDQIPTTENGLTTTSQNGNPTDYNAPTSLGHVNGVDPRFRIYGDAPVVLAQSIPTASALGLLIMALVLLATGLITRRKYSV